MSSLATLLGLVVAVVVAVVGFVRERKRRKEAERLRQEDRAEAERLRQEDRAEAERLRQKERQREEARRLALERKIIVDLIRSLNHHKVLTEELDHAEKFYGTPQNMFDALKEIRTDIESVQKELDVKHPDTKLLAEMVWACNEFAKILEPYTVNEKFSSGGGDFYVEIGGSHFDLLSKVADKKSELAARHGIDPFIE